MDLKIIIAIVVTIIVLIICAFLIFMITKQFKENNNCEKLNNIFERFIKITNKILNNKEINQNNQNTYTDLKFINIKKLILNDHCNAINSTIDVTHIENVIFNSELKYIHYFNHIFVDKVYNIVNYDETFKKLLYIIGVNLMCITNSDKIRGIVYGYTGFEYNMIYFIYMVYKEYGKNITVNAFYKIIIGYIYSNRMYCVFDLKRHPMIRNIYFGKQSLFADIDSVEFIKNEFYNKELVKKNYYNKISDKINGYTIRFDLIRSLDLFNNMFFSTFFDKNVMTFINMFLSDQTQTLFFVLDSNKSFNKDLKSVFNYSFENKYISYNILKEIYNKIDIKSIKKSEEYGDESLIHDYSKKALAVLKSVNINKTLKNELEDDFDDYYDEYYSFNNTFYDYVNKFNIDVSNYRSVSSEAFNLNKEISEIDYHVENTEFLIKEIKEIYSKCANVAKIERNGEAVYNFNNSFKSLYGKKDAKNNDLNNVYDEIERTVSYIIDNIETVKLSDIMGSLKNINKTSGILTFLYSSNISFNTLINDLLRFYSKIELEQLAKVNIDLEIYSLLMSVLIFMINSDAVNTWTKNYYQNDIELSTVLYVTCIIYYNNKNITISELLDIITGFSISVKKYTFMNKAINYYDSDEGVIISKQHENKYVPYLINNLTGLFNNLNIDDYIKKCENYDSEYLQFSNFSSNASIKEILSPFNILSNFCCSDDDYKEKFMAYISFSIGFYKYKYFIKIIFNYISSLTFTKQFFIPSLFIPDSIVNIVCDNNNIFKENIDKLYKVFTLLAVSNNLINCGSKGDMYKIYKYCENHRVEDYFAISLEQYIDEYKK